MDAIHYIMYGDIAVAAESLMIPERPFLQSLGQPYAALFSSNSHYEVGFGHKSYASLRLCPGLPCFVSSIHGQTC